MGKRGKKELKRQLDSLFKNGKLEIPSREDHFQEMNKTVIPPCDFCGQTEDTKLCSGCQLVAYCSKEHQTLAWPVHRGECKAARRNRAKNAFKLEVDEDSPTGRYCIADRDIAQGEIILEELPLFYFSPRSKLTGRPLGQCVTCGLEVKSINQGQSQNPDPNMNGDALTRCPICNWPCCSRACAEAPIHAKHECRLFVLNAIKYPELESGGSRTRLIQDVESDEDEDELHTKRSQRITRSILVTRGYSVWVQEKTTTWKKIVNAIPGFKQKIYEDAGFVALVSQGQEDMLSKSNLLNTLELRRKYKSSLVEMEKSFPLLPKSDELQVKFLQNMILAKLETGFSPFLSFCVTPDSQRQITNLSTISRKFIYETALHFVHSCIPNCNWAIGPFPDYKIRVRAALQIQKGAILTLSRSSLPFFDTQSRQKLMYHPSTICTCPLCSDPTENQSFQSALACPKCIKKAQESESELTGYSIPFNPEAKSKGGKVLSPLAKSNFEDMIHDGPQKWACFQCGDICNPNAIFKGNAALFKLVSQFTSFKHLMPKTKASEVKEEDQLLDKLRALGRKNWLYISHYIVQHAQKDYKSPIVPNFPDYPQLPDSEFPDSARSSEDSKVSAESVENSYTVAIKQHAHLLQILNKTFPGLQDERIEIAEKLGTALMTQCKRIVDPAVVNLKMKNANTNDFFEESKFWLETVCLCQQLLHECLLFYEGVWPSQNYNVNDRILALRGKIEEAGKFQKFHGHQFQDDETCAKCICNNLYKIFSEPVGRMIRSFSCEQKQITDENSISKVSGRNLINDYIDYIDQPRTNNIKKIDPPTTSKSKGLGEKLSQGIESFPTDSRAKLLEETTKLCIPEPISLNKMDPAGTGTGTDFNPQETPVKESISNCLNGSDLSKRIGDPKLTKTPDIDETHNLAPSCSSNFVLNDDPDHFFEKAKIDSDTSEAGNFERLAETPAECESGRAIKQPDDFGITSFLEENPNTLLTNDENLVTQESISIEELTEFLLTYKPKFGENETFVKNVLSSSKSEEPLMMVLKQLGFDQNLLQKSEESIKTSTTQSQKQLETSLQLKVEENDPNFIAEKNIKSENALELNNNLSLHCDEQDSSVKNPPQESCDQPLKRIPQVPEKTQITEPKAIKQTSNPVPQETKKNDPRMLQTVAKSSADLSKKQVNSVPKHTETRASEAVHSTSKSFEESTKKPENVVPKPQKTSRASHQSQNIVKSEKFVDQINPSKMKSQKKSVQTKQWDFFISKLPAQAESSHLISYLEGHGRSKISVEKIPPKFKSQNQQYSSFRVKFETPNHVQAGEAQYWPAGSIVRRWHSFQTQLPKQGQGQRSSQGQFENTKATPKTPKVKQDRKAACRSAAPSETKPEVQNSHQNVLPNVQNNVPSLENKSSQQLCIVC